MINRGFASACKGAYLAYVTAARAKQSTIYRAKPNPPKKGYTMHLAIIMDGNGRWAQLQGKPRQAGHKKGASNVRTITNWCAKHDIGYLTLYAFSTENWNRPKTEVDFLMKLLERYLRDEAKTYHDNAIRFRAIGDIDFFSQPLKHLILDLESSTSHYTNLTQTLALNYGSRNEITRACRKIVLASPKLSDDPQEAAKALESTLANALDTADMPDVDLLIRTGGEQRLSNFLLWQASYAELAFTQTLWPDFNTNELARIIEEFHSRTRRFGGL